MPFFWDYNHYAEITSGLRHGHRVDAETWRVMHGLKDCYAVVVDGTFAFLNIDTHGGQVSPTDWSIYSLVNGRTDMRIESLPIAHDALPSVVAEAIAARIQAAQAAEASTEVEKIRSRTVIEQSMEEIRSAIDRLGDRLIEHAALAVEVAGESVPHPNPISTDAAHLAQHFKQMAAGAFGRSDPALERLMQEMMALLVNAYARIEALEVAE